MQKCCELRHVFANFILESADVGKQLIWDLIRLKWDHFETFFSVKHCKYLKILKVQIKIIIKAYSHDWKTIGRFLPIYDEICSCKLEESWQFGVSPVRGPPHIYQYPMSLPIAYLHSRDTELYRQRPESQPLDSNPE